MFCPGIVPDPLVLDHTFPRSIDELNIAQEAVANLYELVCIKNLACLIIPESFTSLVEMTEWENCVGQTREIYRFLSLLMLQQNSNVKLLRLDMDLDELHPIPGSGSDGPLIEYWQKDLAKLHQEHIRYLGAEYAIGIICSHSLADKPKQNYRLCSNTNVFPLIDSNELATLKPIYEYVCHPDILRQPVSFSDAKKNVLKLGATGVRPPSGSSHWIATFNGGRSWPIDINHDPIPRDFIKELEDIVNLPYDAIHVTLVTGEKPEVRFRLYALESDR